MILDTPYFKPNGTMSCPDPLILFDEACRIPCDIQLHPRQKYLDLYRAGFWIGTSSSLHLNYSSKNTVHTHTYRWSWTCMLSTYHVFMGDLTWYRTDQEEDSVSVYVVFRINVHVSYSFDTWC